MYRLELTPGEYRALEWLEPRGYAANMIQHAYIIEMTPDSVALVFSEPGAWRVLEDVDADPHAFMACASRDLADKVYQFTSRIV